MMHRFYAHPATLHDEHLVLDNFETRHLRDVLRLTSGANVMVFDGQGNEYRCTITEIGDRETEVLVLGEEPPTSPESTLDLTLGAAMLKGDKTDVVVQKAVELGVRKLVPLRSIRCEVRSKDSVKRVLRWRKIALEATKQSGRARIMEVTEPMEFTELIASCDPKKTLLFSERDGEKFSGSGRRKGLTAIVGPEGGWDDSELADARRFGVSTVTLGGRTMRADTAAIAVTAILQNRFGDMV